ncbi:hypothetical protein P4O66_001142 [Electrophorus voltai]|uniref:ribonuclease H n=1 Tax=Electrophorus voltai TaxID=2609070 RepID=A0AAD8ZAT4_9TELE|nr:hypothetical protein P4O66_001142 [Electrophorus voltai]
MTIDSPETDKKLTDPWEYSDLVLAFSPAKASQLPPHMLKECAVPPMCRIYPLSLEEERTMGQYIKEALHQGYICPSTSPALASVFFVKKKDGGPRPCMDYRGLNELLIPYTYPLPLIPTALEQLRGVPYFTKLDLHSTYNLIKFREGDEWKNAFSITSGHYEYLVLPYGLPTAPSIFQAYNNEVLREFLNRSVIANNDNILI